jgi:hypothetical protein
MFQIFENHLSWFDSKSKSECCISTDLRQLLPCWLFRRMLTGRNIVWSTFKMPTSKCRQYVLINRVTRSGNFSSNCLLWAVFENYRSSLNYWTTFPLRIYIHILCWFWQKWVGSYWGDYFSNSFGHSAR